MALGAFQVSNNILIITNRDLFTPLGGGVHPQHFGDTPHSLSTGGCHLLLRPRLCSPVAATSLAGGGFRGDKQKKKKKKSLPRSQCHTPQSFAYTPQSINPGKYPDYERFYNGFYTPYFHIQLLGCNTKITYKPKLNVFTHI
jgi:hypothetical protein